MSSTDGTGGEWMDLADAITLLRDQIAESQRRITDPTGRGDKGVRFTMGEITLDLGLELTGTKGVNGGLKWSVISLGGKKESSTKATHTLHVKLTPQQTGGGDVEVGDEE
ncbi:trypco2 family protein [Streptomyces sp. NPDC020817]|uniref:trypco2 family protein n=1 Tax=Streptomyces sp. NPDC020817 TaxID=3365095 RepID=UPI00378A5D6B